MAPSWLAVMVSPAGEECFRLPAWHLAGSQLWLSQLGNVALGCLSGPCAGCRGLPGGILGCRPGT